MDTRAMKPTFLHFPNLYQAWRGINEYLFLEPESIELRGGGMYGTEWVSQNNFVVIDEAIVKPDFDFGLKLGYNIKKWTMLVNNYVDFRYLELLRADVRTREFEKKQKFYNVSFHFSNLYGGGKDCLVCLIFTRRVGVDHPVVNFIIRTSEVTKRLLFDFLLVQRIIEYVYGVGKKVEVHFMAPSYYITAESFVMYNNIRSIKKLLRQSRDGKPNHWWQDKCINTFNKYYNHPDPDSVIYRVTRRSIMQIKRDENGLPLSGVKSLLAKDLVLIL